MGEASFDQLTPFALQSFAVVARHSPLIVVHRGRRQGGGLSRALNLYAIGFLVWSLLPFDFLTSLSELAYKLRSHRFELQPFTDPHSSRVELWTAFGIDVLLIGLWASLVLRRGGDVVRDILSAISIGLLFSIAVESLQVAVISRVSSSTDVIAGAIGVTIGVAVARVTAARRRTDRPVVHLNRRGLWTPATILYTAFLFVVFWSPFDLIRDSQLIRERLQAFASRPFAAMQSSGSDIAALFNVIRNLGWFAPLGFLCGSLVESPVGLAPSTRRFLYGIAVLWVLGTAVLIELEQLALASHDFDLSSPAFRFIGG